ncbi:MAG: peptidase S10 [Chloroflexi bacterium]|nr:peptidase S10 [Chloroflexota bacterium]
MTDENNHQNGQNNGQDGAPESKPQEIPEKPPVETQHQITIGGQTLDYTATTGIIPLRDPDKDEVTARVFFTAYTLNDVEDRAERPLVFVFNGGPGSSSVWLHLGAVGPRRVVMQDEGWMPAPPFRLEDNPFTWLDLADLVFIDPVGTGYSRAADPEKKKEFWSLENDLKSVGEFMRLYLTRYQRWHSPLFLAGESYGTTRAAGLAGYLFDRGIAFNGLMLISTVLNFQTIVFEQGNDLPYILYLPTYAATAWYHQRLPDDLQQKPLRAVLDEVEAWATYDYTVALAKGDTLTEDERRSIIAQLARYTGLSERFIDLTNLRIRDRHFFKELLRDEQRTVGRLDSRFKGIDKLGVTESIDHDPAMSDITPPYTAMLYQYLRGELEYESDAIYEILSFDVNRGWEWERGKFPDTSEPLRSALSKNPFMQVLVAMGYYDLATPHFGSEYTLSHMDLDPTLRDNLHLTYYEAGHMMYLDVPSLEQFKADVAQFMGTALGGE